MKIEFTYKATVEDTEENLEKINFDDAMVLIADGVMKIEIAKIICVDDDGDEVEITESDLEEITKDIMKVCEEEEA